MSSTPSYADKGEGKGEGKGTGTGNGNRSSRPLSDFDGRAWIPRFVDAESFYRGQLQTPFNDMVRWWQLYLAKRADRRGPDEQWRANVFVPYPYSGVETKVAAMCDILNSEPYMSMEGVGDEDEDPARGVDRLVDYTLRKNLWRSRSAETFREAGIQGTSIINVSHVKRSSKVKFRVTENIKNQFMLLVQKAIAQGAPTPPNPKDDAKAFEMWRTLWNTSKRGDKIPAYPTSGLKDVVAYEGPWFERASIFGFRFDPLIADVQDQPMFMRRVVRSKAWLDRQIKAGVFDEAAVAKAMSKWDNKRFEDWEDEISEMVGVSSPDLRDPMMNGAVEIFEVFEPDDEDAPYKCVLNRAEVINTDMGWPYEHGLIPYCAFRNVPIPGRFLGISELQQPEELFYEMNKLRSLRLDGVTLTTLKMLVKQKDSGMPELRRVIKPGAVWEETRQNGVRFLESTPVPPEAFRELFEIKNDIDETNSTPSQLRGNPSTVGRVSATESERRYSAALVRIKQLAVSMEDQMSPAIEQALMLWMEFGDDPIVMNIEGQANPMYEVPRENLLYSLQQDYKFRGATRVLDKNMQTQQMLQYAQAFANDFAPAEKREVMRRIWVNMGLKGVDQVVSEDGTKVATTLWQQRLAAQAAQGGQPSPMGPGGGLTPPDAQPPGQGAPGAPGAPGQPPPPDQGSAAGGPPQAGGEVGPGPQDAGAELVNALQQGSSIQAPGVVG